MAAGNETNAFVRDGSMLPHHDIDTTTTPNSWKPKHDNEDHATYYAPTSAATIPLAENTWTTVATAPAVAEDGNYTAGGLANGVVSIPSGTTGTHLIQLASRVLIDGGVYRNGTAQNSFLDAINDSANAGCSFTGHIPLLAGQVVRFQVAASVPTTSAGIPTLASYGPRNWLSLARISDL